MSAAPTTQAAFTKTTMESRLKYLDWEPTENPAWRSDSDSGDLPTTSKMMQDIVLNIDWYNHQAQETRKYCEKHTIPAITDESIVAGSSSVSGDARDSARKINTAENSLQSKNSPQIGKLDSTHYWLKKRTKD